MSAAATPAELERAAYRARVVAGVARSGAPLSDDAAFVVDVLASTPQLIMHDPLTLYARLHFDAHAEDQGHPALTREEIAVALDELAARDLLPTWCTHPGTYGGGAL